MEFTACIENFNTRLWSYHLKVPNLVANHFLEQEVKRVVCTLNKTVELQCAIMPAGDGMYFILINKKIRDQLNLKEGSKVEVRLEKDESEFGLPFPAELAEVMEQDKVGRDYFYKLTPGKQRNLIYAAGQVKNPDLRIQRAMVLVEHLKKNKGKIDFKQLCAELKTTS
ncbi:MAG: YdeI/OmpD-associated family protein [Saprospiraceae bacterium]|nr:YdeI/OmpD-associated family protein [Saprospiraceae bacterium]